MSDEKSLFEKMVSGEIPVEKLHEDQHCIVIKDKFPKTPLHLLVIPKKHMAKIADMQGEDKELIGHLINVATEIAKENNCTDYRLQFNNGERAGQTIFHLHLHLMGWL